jgi:hypothetical protein
LHPGDHSSSGCLKAAYGRTRSTSVSLANDRLAAVSPSAAYSGAFLADAVGTLRSGSLQQLWLDHLLVLALRRADNLDSVLFVLAFPQSNDRCREAVLAYRATLDANQPTTFEARTLEEIASVFEEDGDAAWAQQFRERYLTPTG